MRLIDADALLKEINSWESKPLYVEQAIRRAPTIEPPDPDRGG